VHEAVFAVEVGPANVVHDPGAPAPLEMIKGLVIVALTQSLIQLTMRVPILKDLFTSIPLEEKSD